MAGSGKTGSTSLRNKLHKMQTQKVIVSILFLCVPLLLLFTFTYLPFFKMVQFSFYDMKYIGKRTWVGLQNYISVFTREDCLNALKLSIFYLVGSFVQIAIALLFASILSFPTKGGKFFRGALYFPSLIGGIAVGFIFKFFFTHGFVLDTLLTWVGMDADSLPFWLKDKSINNWVLAATSQEIGIQTGTYFLATDNYISENKEVLAKFLQAIDESTQYINDHLDETAEYLESDLGIKAEDFKANWENYSFTPGFSEEATQHLEDIEKWGFEHGSFPKDYNVRDFITTEAVDIAYPDQETAE